MDKKNIRLNQNSAKSLVTDRKSQDAKQWPRSRNRDSKSKPNSQTNSDPSRNNNKPQSKANSDKRAFNNSRGNGHQRSVSTSTGTGLDDSDHLKVELNSVYLPGSKKQNLNHLLNFNYVPRDASQSLTFQRTGNHRQHAAKRFIKEQFLQATCQFIIRSEIDNSILLTHMSSADHLIDWMFVEQVNVLSSEEPQCPICLYQPVAAKMTRCGHVYCWSCILHYLSMSEKALKKCPICYEIIQVDDLKSSFAKPTRCYNVGDYVTLNLMCREKSLLKVHRANKMKFSGFPYMSGDADDILHSKLVLANPQEIMKIIEREKNELQFQLETDDPICSESVYIQQALDLLNKREQAVLSKIQNVQCKASLTSAEALNSKLQKLNMDSELSKDFVGKQSNEFLEEQANLTKWNIERKSPINDSNYLYFYQSSDGQCLYLHKLNNQMLQAMYGDNLDRAPHTIRGKIVEKEVFSMTDELRKRYKHLQHLPLTCLFEVVELTFGRKIISDEVMIEYEATIKKRQKKRQRRAREEKRRDIKINEVNERKIGKIIAHSANIDVNSDRQFPTCGNSTRNDPPLSLLSSDLSPSPSPSTAGPSFAMMLGKSNSVDLWPSLSPPSNNVWINSVGSSKQSEIAKSTSQMTNDYYESDDEEYVGPPEFKSNFGTVLAVALEKSTFNQGDNGKKKNKGKNKKKNKTVVFSTGSFKGNLV